MLYIDIFKALNKARVGYAVAGGVAVVLHGYLRFTADLDLVIDLKKKNAEKFFVILQKLGYNPKIAVNKEEFASKTIRRRWIKEKNAVVFTFFHRKDPLMLIDVFIREPIAFSMIKKKIIRIKLRNIVIPVISLNHLIKLKKISGRPSDIMDVKNLQEIKLLRKK